MRNLIKLIARYHFFLLFVAIEIVALSFVFSSNNYQKTFFVNFSRNISGNLYQRFSNWSEYLSLRELNEELAQENVRLKRSVLRNALLADISDISPDSLLIDRYYYNSARVINQTVNRQRNFLTLNIGSNEGVELEMAVISADGVVGIVNGVSERFSTVIPLINIDIRVSSIIKSNDYFGSLSWDGRDYRTVILSEIPHHALITHGDTVVTSGYSAIFPFGLPIGTVADFEIKGANFYEIRVELFTDFKKLSHVYVLGNKLKEERNNLEKQLKYD